MNRWIETDIHIKSTFVEIWLPDCARLKIFQTVKYMKTEFLKISGKGNSLSDLCHSTI